jgi:cardiolipin synthase
MSQHAYGGIRNGLLTVGAVACSVLYGCANLPDADDIIEQASDRAATPQLVGARGPLTGQQSKAILARLELQAGGSDLLQRHLAVEQALAESPLAVGNRTHLLSDGTETFRAMFAAIRAATKHINLEYYILEDVASDNQKLSDLLISKRQQGVQINIIYDSYGSGDTPSDFFNRLRSNGINLLAFNPVNPLDARADYSLNDRDHRKILVVDGTVAIVGGVNLSSAYQSNPVGKSGAKSAVTPAYWRDTDLELEGPAVRQLQTLFLSTWAKQNGPVLDSTTFFPAVPATGSEAVRIIGSTPDHAVPRYYATLLSAIRTAEKSIWLSTAYFVPTHQELEDLSQSARRGVDVRLLLPGQSDSDLSLSVARSHYAELLEAGVKIYEFRDTILHSKSAVIDGVWSVVGSSNFDHRSVLFNDEVDAVVLGADTGHQLEQLFQNELQSATEITARSWDDRPLPQKIKEVLSRTWQRLL